MNWLGFDVRVKQDLDNETPFYKDILSTHGDRIGYVMADMYGDPETQHYENKKFAVVYIYEYDGKQIPLWIISDEEEIKELFEVVIPEFCPNKHNEMMKLIVNDYRVNNKEIVIQGIH